MSNISQIYSLGGDQKDWTIHKVWVDDMYYYFEAINPVIGRKVKCTKEGNILE